MLWLNISNTILSHQVQPYQITTCQIRYSCQIYAHSVVALAILDILEAHFIMSITNDDDDAERQAFLPRDTCIEEKTSLEIESSTLKHYQRHLRLALEVFMALVILILSTQIIYDKKTIRRSPVPDCMSKHFSAWLDYCHGYVPNVRQVPLKTYTFNENLKYMNESMFSSRDATLRTLHNWIELSSGSISSRPLRRHCSQIGISYSWPGIRPNR
jgi:hypothetical protein